MSSQTSVSLNKIIINILGCKTFSDRRQPDETMLMQNLQDILDLSPEALDGWLESHRIKPFRAKQIMKWLYGTHVQSFEKMTDLSKDFRKTLADEFYIGGLEKVRVEASEDGSRKYLFKLADQNHIETVLMPEDDHFTICISSQVGCAQGCAFCLTAKGGFVRNLSRSEIISQIREVKKDLPDPLRLTNIVIMGMGEPLYNYDNMISALKTIIDGDYGLKFSRRRVTLSTAGVASRLIQLSHDTPVNLAVSLNATDNETRSRLMPINRKFPMAQLLDACRHYHLRPRRRITFEYILIKDLNDTDENARKLIKLLAPIRAKVNLIPFNEHSESDFKRPVESRILTFQEILRNNGLTAIVRRSKGADISAACGQLRAKAANP